MKQIGWFVVSVVLVQAAAVGAAGPRNIFDDDWTPPKSTEAPHAASTRPATPTNPPPHVESSTVPPKDDLPGTVARHAVPAKSEQASVRKVMKEVFAEQLVDRSIPGRRKLAEKLLTQAEKATNAPVDQFVLLAAAVDAGTEAVNLTLAFKAGDQMGKAFEVDALAINVETATKLSAKSGAADLAAENVRAGLELVDRLSAGDDYPTAVRVCTALISMAGANAVLRTEIQKRQRDLGTARAAGEKVAKDVEKLKAAPEDPAANLAVGRYYCFVKGDWHGGLPHLAKGSDAGLKALAAQELAAPAAANEVVQIADAWWDVGAKQADLLTRGSISQHAAALYKRVLEGTSSLRRAQIEKRIADAARSTAADGKVSHEIVVEALIDTVCSIHVTAKGIYWTNQQFNKPGMHDGVDAPTYVDGVAWKPKWSKPGSRGTDTSEGFAMKIGNATDFKAEVIGCAEQRGTDKIDQRDPITSEIVNGEFVVTIPDTQAGARWYRIRLSYRQ